MQPSTTSSAPTKRNSAGFDMSVFDSDSSDDDDDDDDKNGKSRTTSTTYHDDDDDDEKEFDADNVLSASTGNVLGTRAKTAMVCSKSYQKYGMVAGQIHAKGVHTSLQMHVDVAPDGSFAFGGVARGSMELLAVDLTAVENYHDANHGHQKDRTDKANKTEPKNLLDLVEVYRHYDAKLRGFGSCTILRNQPEPTYMLLSGRGIKNIHIWSFRPVRNQWDCLYDTQTNGNSISLLHLRYNPLGQLQAISKCDNQKLRVWDLSFEQSPRGDRPKRPPYRDIVATESTMGIGGEFAFGGSFQQVSMVHLDMTSAFNHTELALPGSSNQSRRTGRQQRGELKSLVGVSGMTTDASHALMQLSDVSRINQTELVSNDELS